MHKRLTIFVEGVTDKLFFSYLISFLFKNAKKKMWDKSHLNIVSLDGIGNSEANIKIGIDELDKRNIYQDAVCLIYDTDAFEYQKSPPINIERIKKFSENNSCEFFSIPVTHNVEDMIVYSLKEILKFLKIPSSYKIPKELSGLNLLKALHKEAGKFYIKGNRCDDLLKILDYSSISKKYCGVLKPLCTYLELNCSGSFCQIKKK